MKNTIHNLGTLTFLGGLLFTANIVHSQMTPSTTTTTTSSDGTVSQFGPDAIVVRSTTSTDPVSYSYSKTTTYVDENGNPVSVQTVKTGAPVIVYYEKDGDGYVADKVVVKKVITTTTPDAAVMMTPQPSAPPAVNGFVTDADSDGISIRTSTSEEQTHYKAHDATVYVDQSGNPISRNTLKKGTPVTIYFERDGDYLMATRVVVRNSIAAQPTTIQTTTTP